MHYKPRHPLGCAYTGTTDQSERNRPRTCRTVRNLPASAHPSAAADSHRLPADTESVLYLDADLSIRRNPIALIGARLDDKHASQGRDPSQVGLGTRSTHRVTRKRAGMHAA
jgi:hypothetical protein